MIYFFDFNTLNYIYIYFAFSLINTMKSEEISQYIM